MMGDALFAIVVLHSFLVTNGRCRRCPMPWQAQCPQQYLPLVRPGEMQFACMLCQVKQALHIAFQIQLSGQIGLSKTNQILVQYQMTQHRGVTNKHGARGIDFAVDALTIPQAHRNRPLIAGQETLQNLPRRNRHCLV